MPETEYLGTLYECLHQIVTLFCLRCAFYFVVLVFSLSFLFFVCVGPFGPPYLSIFLKNWGQDNLSSSSFDMTPGFQPFAIVLFNCFLIPDIELSCVLIQALMYLFVN